MFTEVRHLILKVTDDEPFPHLKDKCRKYKAWCFAHVYAVDPSDRTVSEWNGSLVETDKLGGIPATRIWQDLDERYSRES